MGKLLLLSLILATIVIPMLAARDTSPVRGMRNTLVGMAVLIALYAFGLVYVLPRLS